LVEVIAYILSVAYVTTDNINFDGAIDDFAAAKAIAVSL
jgi:hypothetical protein